VAYPWKGVVRTHSAFMELLEKLKLISIPLIDSCKSNTVNYFKVFSYWSKI
jgi:hypothetical protein